MTDELNKAQLPLLRMRIDLIVKDGPKTLFELKGRTDASYFRVMDVNEVFKLEASLENLTGYRFHINLVTE